MRGRDGREADAARRPDVLRQRRAAAVARGDRQGVVAQVHVRREPVEPREGGRRLRRPGRCPSASAPSSPRARSGLNTSLLAYGQTGSGKTYSMMGPGNALGADGAAVDEGAPRDAAPVRALLSPRAATRASRTSAGATAAAAGADGGPPLAACDAAVRRRGLALDVRDYNEKVRDLLPGADAPAVEGGAGLRVRERRATACTSRASPSTSSAARSRRRAAHRGGFAPRDLAEDERRVSPRTRRCCGAHEASRPRPGRRAAAARRRRGGGAAAARPTARPRPPPRPPTAAATRGGGARARRSSSSTSRARARQLDGRGRLAHRGGRDRPQRSAT